MFLRVHKRWKNGKQHRYFSVVENCRVAGGKVTQRTVLYLGEINDSQRAAWRKTLEVFDESRRESRQLCLFPHDRPLPPEAINAVQVKLTGMQLRRPRAFGDCWLGCWLWRRLGLDRFWQRRLGEVRGGVPWEKVLQLLVVHRLIDPGSEFRLHRQWFDRSAMDELLGVDLQAAAKDRLYRCLDRLLEHKEDVFGHLRRCWRNLFNVEFDVLLYDLTSTYFEGLCQQNPKAKHGYSRDHRPDCRQVVIALIVTPEGFPLAYEVLAGNTADHMTLGDFLAKIEARYGKARRVWVMDRGIPTEEVLAEMRQAGIDYLVGTPRSQLNKLQEELLELPWQQVRESVRVKLLRRDGELYVLAQSQQRAQKEKAIRRRKLRKLFGGLRRLQKNCRSRDRLLEKLGALKHQAGRAAKLVEITVPPPPSKVTAENFHFHLKVAEFKRAERRDGAYLLRTTLGQEDPRLLWERYILLTEIEAAFRCLKSDLVIRPIYHQLGHRVEAHIFVAFLGYCLMVTLRNLLRPHAPGLTAKAVLETLATIQMVDVWLPTTDGRWLVMPRHTHPEAEHRILLNLLRLSLPAQPPPRITAAQLPAADQGKDQAAV
jgi:hypothetical protein